ncbi:MAG TPA: 5'-nucleotidase C-terminal domain-containing protein [Archangium sp.]|nr:5'-nucleotidase C-terminal domain-containing protein [Archangium sp.]
MSRLLLSCLFLLSLSSCQSKDDVMVTLISMSDYHSHAVPFYSEGKHDQAGMARMTAWLKTARQNPHTLVVSGGDTMNLGTPTWSDEYRCTDWAWLDGLVDVMAVGNHELDYGPEEFMRCVGTVSFPIISSNFVGGDGQPLLRPGGKPYVIREVQGVRIGFFALGGPDFPALIRANLMPAGSSWTEPIAVARDTVKTLREVEKVDAVVFIGHQHREHDEAMARAVPGIDVIFGSHSHNKSELVQIPGTSTWFISPYQYGTYMAQVRLRFKERALRQVSGELVKLDETQPKEPAVASQVDELQRQLVARRPERFEVLGQAQVELSDANLNFGESVVGNWATEVLRKTAGTHAFFSTASSFRAGIPPGDITVEGFYTAIPYRNTVMTADVTGEQLLAWLTLSVSKRGSDAFSQQTGVRYRVVDGKPTDVQVLVDPSRPEAGSAALVPTASYRLGTTNFQALVAGGYKELFATFANPVNTGKDAHTVLINAIRAAPITATLDGRTGGN